MSAGGTCCRYSAVSLLEAEFKTLDMRRAGFSAAELRRAGLGASELKRVGCAGLAVFGTCRGEVSTVCRVFHDICEMKYS